MPHFGVHFKDQVVFHCECKRFLTSQGLVSVDVLYACSLEDLLHMMGHLNPLPRYLLGGTSATGVSHTVVGRGGKLERDPSQDDAGIIGPCDDGYFWITWITWITWIVPIGLRGQRLLAP